MSRFETALAEHPAPRALGDVVLRYEPSMLIGQTPLPLRSWRPSVAWLLGVSALVCALAAFLLRTELGLIILLLIAGAFGLSSGVYLEQLDRRRRAFVANFGTNSLRLDFVTPIAGRPRTLVVHFDGVRELALLEQADGAQCLTVDVLPAPGARALIREVLVAHIPEAQREDAQRLKRVLEGAFGLGAPPGDSPYFSAPVEAQGTVEPTHH